MGLQQILILDPNSNSVLIPFLPQWEYLVIILIMPERHFHFLSVVADRLQDGPAAWPQLRNESESAVRALLKCKPGIPFYN